MKYYIIAGEASGDIHGSELILELKKYDKSANIRFWGGDKMKSAGGKLIKHYKKISFMGFWEVFINLPKIINNLAFCKKDIRKFNPNAIIYIDYPGFNLRIAKWAKKNNFTNIYYISPQIWAWKESRIKIIKSCIDKMFVILPFEKDYYKIKHNYNVSYVKNSLIDKIKKFKKLNKSNFLNKNKIKLNSKIIALLPGSRKQEIKKMLPTFSKISTNYSQYLFVIAGVKEIDKKFYLKYIKNKNIKLIFDQTYDILNNSVAAIVTSGTATLETALFGVPQIVCYKSNPLSYFIAKKIINLKYISLVNIIMNKKVVEEIIQGDFNINKISEEINKILDVNIRTNQIENYLKIQKKFTDNKYLGNLGKEIVGFLKN